MGQAPNHRIFICTSCRHSGSTCQPGYALIERLRAAILAGGDAISDDFEVSGVACMAACNTPCTVGYQASKKAVYLFGNIDADQDIDELVAFARLYRSHEDGLFSGKLYPEKLRGNTLARVPSMIIAAEACDRALQ